MKWISVNNGSAVENFELWNDDNKLAGISFSRHTRFARIVSNLGKRIFSFEKKGFLSEKEVLKNEYGIRMGKVEELKPGTGKGYVELDGKKYFFEYNKNNSGELMLYDESMQKNLLSCSFKSIVSSLTKTKSLLTGSRFASLLLVLCWYTFNSHSAPQSNTVAEAVV
jgi:hypothetical protein